ncbi:MAG: anti-sigma F factor [Christensenellales bacterium]|jgi:stage II sporulation protein AB (anti-sigma F factor)
MENSMTLRFLALSRNESFARAVASAFFAQLDPTLAELADLKTAVSEAVTNCVVHAYGDDAPKNYITLTMTMTENEATVVIEDTGRGIEDIEKARLPFFTTAPGEERSGMGFSVMEAFMDSLIVESSLGKGTRVTMTKRVGEQK